MKKIVIHRFRNKLRQLEREIGAQFKMQTMCCGVSLAQCHTLVELGELGETSISNLSDILNLDKSTLSRTIDGLVKDGLVKRVIDPNDRRYMSVTLTEKGKKTCESINHLCDEFYTKVFEKIPNEKHGQVVEGLALLMDALTNTKNDTVEKDVCQCSN